MSPYSILSPFLEFINYTLGIRRKETPMGIWEIKSLDKDDESSRFSYKRVHRLGTCRLGWHNWFLHCRSWQQWSAQHNNTWPCHFPCAARTGREVRCVWVRVRLVLTTENRLLTKPGTASCRAAAAAAAALSRWVLAVRQKHRIVSYTKTTSPLLISFLTLHLQRRIKVQTKASHKESQMFFCSWALWSFHFLT